MDKLLEMKLTTACSFDHLASVYEEYTGKIAVENLRPSWLIFSDGFRKTPRAAARQARCSTSSLAAIGLVLRVPVMAAGRARRAADVAGPGALPPAARRPARPVFTVHKFRSMRAGRRGGDRRRLGAGRTTRASRRSAASCAARGSTSCRSSGTCCAAT